MSEEQRPYVGIGVMIFKEGKVLMAQRKNAHGAGEWAFPGGHLEYMESFEACAYRETIEECGLEIRNVRFLMLANVKTYSPRHYVHITLAAEWKNGEPMVLEPEKSGEWKWFALDDLPEPMFETCKLSFESYKNKTDYIDANS